MPFTWSLSENFTLFICIVFFLFSAGPTADSLKQWLVVFEGAPDSLYEGGTFFALLTFDDDYPFTPPTVSLEFRVSSCCDRFNLILVGIQNQNISL